MEEMHLNLIKLLVDEEADGKRIPDDEELEGSVMADQIGHFFSKS